MSEPLFKIGDKVRIVKYGHKIWQHDSGIKDIADYLVGQEGIVDGFSEPQFNYKKKYSLSGIKGKSAWYDEEQLELIV